MRRFSSTTDEKDRYGEKIRVLGKVRTDLWAAENDREAIAKAQARAAASESSRRSKTPRTFKNILCAIDYSDSSLKALRLARQIALQNDSTVYLIHVCQAMVVPIGGVVTNPPAADEAARARLRKLASQQLDGVDHYEVVATGGDPARVLLKTADQLKVDLIVIGTHGRKGISRFLLGSVAEKTLRRAPCPVLTSRAN